MIAFTNKYISNQPENAYINITMENTDATLINIKTAAAYGLI